MQGVKLTHLDLCAGYGGFTLAAQQLGIETVGYAEIDKWAAGVYQFHYPDKF